MALLQRLLRSDYFILARFLISLAFTVVAVDLGEQFLNRSVARTVHAVDTLAAYGLAYVIVKFFMGMLGEVKQAGLVLVHDRPGFHKILICVLVVSSSIGVLLIVIAETQLGVWLIEDLHGVSSTVSKLTHTALLFLFAYPLIDAVSWYHGGVLLQWRHSTLVAVASLADIIGQIFSVAILLYTPLVCTTPIAVPILAAYGGVVTRCAIVLVGFYRLVYPKLKKETMSKVTVWKLVAFLLPLMLMMSAQRISRPMINLLVARFSSTKCQAAEALAVLTATYPLGHLGYGWLNQLRPLIPAFMKENQDKNRPVIRGKKIAIFSFCTFLISAAVSFVLFWVPGVSEVILQQAVGISHSLAVLSVNPLRVFAFFCFTVVLRATLAGWLTHCHQTKLVTPSAFIRVAAIVAVFFTLLHLGVSGAFLGVAALFSGFFTEMVIMVVFASSYACWRHWRAKRRQRRKKKEEKVVQESAELKSLHYCKELELAPVDRESSLSQLSSIQKRVCQDSEEVAEEESSSCRNQSDFSHKTTWIEDKLQCHESHL